MVTLLSNPIQCQTIGIDNIDISIGDSLECVIKKFGDPPYHIRKDTLENYLCYSIYKEIEPHIDNSSIPVRIIAHLYFDYFRSSIPITFTKELYKIDKVRNNDNANDAKNLLKIIKNIVEKNNIDKYSTELSLSKNIEPDYATNTITIRINPFTALDIYYREDNYYEISEVITRDENRFADEEFILIFEDSEHLVGKQNHIMEIFKKEDDAEYRSRELSVPYLTRGWELPNFQILRFYKKRFFK